MRIIFVVLSILLSLALLGLPSTAVAQTAKIYRIGFLGSESTSYDQPALDALRSNLRELGYVEGKNLVIDVRLAQGRYDQLPVLAAELVSRKVNVVVTSGLKATLAAKQVTATMPIVSTNMGDAVNAGVVESYAKPAGNVTGMSGFSREVMVKRLELLKEADPRVVRVALLVNPSNPNFGIHLQDLRDRAISMKVTVDPVEVSGAETLEKAFHAIAQQKIDAVIVHGDTMFVAHREAISDLLAKHRIASAGWQGFSSILIGYGANIRGM